MKRESLISRSVVALLAAGAITNCGRNGHPPANLNPNGPLLEQERAALALRTQKPPGAITGPDTSRTTKTISRDATPDQCPNGGNVSIRFDDANGNGQPDPGEQVRDATIYCNGSPGTSGYSIVSREIDPDKQTCPHGGISFIQFIDGNGDGTYSPDGKGDKLIGAQQTKCFTESGKAQKLQPRATIGKTIRAAAQADCPSSGGKGQVVQFYFDMNGDGKLQGDQGETLALELPACATPKATAAIQSIAPTSTVSNGCVSTSFPAPPPTDGSAPLPPITISSCNSIYTSGFAESVPVKSNTCPNGGVILAHYINEDGDGLINTLSEKKSMIAPVALCFGRKSADGNTIATASVHITSLTKECVASGGAGTRFTTFVSKDGSGNFKTGSDVVIAQFSVCDPSDGKPPEGAPLILPESRTATADELTLGHCSSNRGIVTQSHLFLNAGALQSWASDHADEQNQGQLLGDANIVCLDPPPVAQVTPQPTPSHSPSPSPSPSQTPAIVRNVTSIRPAPDGDCPDGSKWILTTFHDHVGDASYDADVDGPAIHQGCVSATAKIPVAGTHSDTHLTAFDSSPDYPGGGYTLSVYSGLALNQKLDGVPHHDYAIGNGPAGPATAINLLDLNNYQWSNPSLAPKTPCAGVAVVNFLDTDGSGQFLSGKDPVLNEFPICQDEQSGTRIRPSTPKDKGCEANAGVVFERYLDKEKAGQFVEGDLITESVPYCPPPAVQPPAQKQSDCVDVIHTLTSRVERVTKEQFGDKNFLGELPYLANTGKIGLGTYGNHRISDAGTDYVQDSQILYHVSLGLPARSDLKDSQRDGKALSLSLRIAATKSMAAKGHPDADMLCLLDSDFPLCSGKRYSGSWEKYLNPDFWFSLGGKRGNGKFEISNEEFSKRLFSESYLKPEDAMRFKYLPDFEISFADLFPTLDQERFLYSSVKRNGSQTSRDFLVEIADDTYASQLGFEAKVKLNVCRTALPAQAAATLALLNDGS